ncbi:membrane spanning protein [Staphylococcus aureus]|nr:membrane spanning protein [Staphylococcus aureus]
MGIVDILFGLLVIFNVGASSAFFIYMFAFWFIFSSISGLFTFSGSGSLKLISVIFNLLGIVFGVILLFNPLMGIVFISTMIAIAFVFVGVIYVVDALA